jgi:hypothetical protein
VNFVSFVPIMQDAGTKFRFSSKVEIVLNFLGLIAAIVSGGATVSNYSALKEFDVTNDVM